MGTGRLLRVVEAARLVGVSPTTIRMCVRRGQLRAVRRHGVSLIPEPELWARWPEGKPLPKGRPRRQGSAD